MIILVCINVIIIFFYRQYLQRELNQDMTVQVTSAVNQYVALSKIPELQKIQEEEKNDAEADPEN